MAEDPSSDEPWRLLSGGVDGRVRVWRVTRQHRAMLSSTKEHRGAVTCLKVTSDLRPVDIGINRWQLLRLGPEKIHARRELVRGHLLR